MIASAQVEKANIDALIQRIDALQDNRMIRAAEVTLYVDDMNRYLIIRISGWLEQTFHAVLMQYVSRRVADEPARQFILEKIYRVRNLNFHRILQTLRQFDERLANQLNHLVSAKGKDDLNSLMDLRNDIAHGHHNKSAYNRTKQYYRSCIELLEQLCSVLLG
jgi:hypothetical protein